MRGRQKPWESEEELSLIWNNILVLTRNFLERGIDVVIDYVTFPKEADWLREQLKDMKVQVAYVVLWTDRRTLVERDKMRLLEHQMGERCLILMEEFLESGLEERHIFNNSHSLDHIIEMIQTDKRYIL